MAGSYKHITTDSGRLRSLDGSMLLDNMGDAKEALEECFGMIWWLAAQVVNLTGPSGITYPPERMAMLAVIEEAREGYRDGLRHGGVQR